MSGQSGERQAGHGRARRAGLELASPGRVTTSSEISPATHRRNWTVIGRRRTWLTSVLLSSTGLREPPSMYQEIYVRY